MPAMLIANVKYLSLPMTIHEAGTGLQNKLKSVYDENEAWNISDWMIEHITGMSRSERIINKTKELTVVQIENIESAEQRLLMHEPVQYVLNEAWFCGMKFYVDKSVLIPRPETEELVEWIISNLKFPFTTLKILDIGSGSGCIPITLKRKLRKAEVWSCDISNSALAVAKKNADLLAAEIKFLELDFLDEKERSKLPEFDIIVSNPPYVPEKDKLQMNKNVVDYEPHIALFAPGDDAFIFYKTIAQFGQKHLNKEGSIFLELHEDYADEIAALFQNQNYLTRLKKDMQGKERFLHSKKCYPILVNEV